MLSRLVRQTSARLAAAGFTRGDPALERIREWNAHAREAGVVHLEERRGQFGKTRRVTLRELYGDSCGWPTCAWHGDAPYTP